MIRIFIAFALICLATGSYAVNIARYQQRNINLLTNTGWQGGTTTPYKWAISGSSTRVATVYGDSGSEALSFSVSANRAYVSQTLTLNANTVYFLSVMLESITGSVTMTNLIDSVTLPSGATNAFSNGGAAAVPTAGQRIWEKITISSTPGSVAMRIGVGAAATSTGSAVLSHPQLEIASPGQTVPSPYAQVL